MLAAYLIHHQDMRRPLGMPRSIPPEWLRGVLDWLVSLPAIPTVGSPARAKGLRLVATDAGWSRGEGPEVSGPGEAVMMALAGRRVALADLDGPGRAILAERLAGEEHEP
jgi:hypothetical protein